MNTPAHHQVAAALCWAEYAFEPVCDGLRLVFAADEPCPARHREFHRRKVQRAPCSLLPLPRIIVNTTRSDQTPPGPACLACLASTPVKF